jgi:hypothetical protein
MQQLGAILFLSLVKFRRGVARTASIAGILRLIFNHMAAHPIRSLAAGKPQFVKQAPISINEFPLGCCGFWEVEPDGVDG